MVTTQLSQSINGMSYDFAKALFISQYGSLGNSEGIPFYNGWSTDASVPKSLTGQVFIGFVSFSSLSTPANFVEFIFSAINAITPSEMRYSMGLDPNFNFIQHNSSMYFMMFEEITFIQVTPEQDLLFVNFMGWKFPLNTSNL